MFLLIILIFGFLPLNVISIIGEFEEEIFLIKDDTKFTFEFIHSIYHVLQQENYILNNQQFILKNVYFGSYDAANYYDPILAKDMKKVSDGGFVFENIDFNMEEINIALAHGTDYSIKVDDKKIDLNEHFNQSVFLKIKIEKVHFLHYLLRRV